MVDPLFALAVFGVVVAVGTVVLWPGWGLVARAGRALRLTERERMEDALKHVWACERQGRSASLESVAGHLHVRTALAAAVLTRLVEAGLVRPEGHGHVLTEEGRGVALRVLRTHRLWERYLADRTGVRAEEWHDRAERMEHSLTAAEADELSARLGHPRFDPHGDPIPTRGGEVPPPAGVPLSWIPAGRAAEVVHVEDEPPELYRELLEAGLAPGVRLEVRERSDARVRIDAGGETRDLSPLAARNVTVEALPLGESAEGPPATLADARPGETVRVVEISPACQGPQRRRLLDLGLVRGTEVTAELRSASGDPVAYRIRGALIGLRREQARQVGVEPVSAPTAVMGGPPAGASRMAPTGTEG